MGVATVGLIYDLARSRASAAPRASSAGPDARADADHRRDLAPQQPGRAARAVPRRAPCGRSTAGCARTGSTRWLVLAGVFVGLGLRDEDGGGAARGPRRSPPAWLWVAPRAASPPSSSCWRGGAAMAAVGLAWPLLMWLTPGVRPPVDLRHGRQLDLVADPRLQRPRPPVRPERRPGRRHGGGGGGGGVFGGSAGPAAPAQRARSAARPAGCSASRSSPASALAVPTRLRRSDARTGCLIAVGGAFAVTAVAFSRAAGHLPPVLRVGARAVHRGARRRRRRRSLRGDRSPGSPVR